jgi:hypothetical protein
MMALVAPCEPTGQAVVFRDRDADFFSGDTIQVPSDTSGFVFPPTSCTESDCDANSATLSFILLLPVVLRRGNADRASARVG